MIVVLAAGAWYVALRVGAADTIVCLDPTPGHHVYRTYEADSGCAPPEICIEQEIRPTTDRLRATDCGPEYGD